MRICRIAVTIGVFCAASFAVVDAFQARRGGMRSTWPPAVVETPENAPTLTAEEEQKTIVLPPGYHAQLVAKQPLVIDPIAVDAYEKGAVREIRGLTKTLTRPWTAPELQGGRGGRGGPGRGGN
jgi:hypothetical protein